MTTKLTPLRALWRALPFTGAKRPLVTVIELGGVIAAASGGALGSRSLCLARVEEALAAAFKPGDLSAVALLINSPGGSPVQSRLIHNAIRRLAKENETPVLSFIEDVGASGGYILAIAGDEIYADDSSIVGSIGVISAGFGVHEAIARFGVERRVHTAGKSKSQLDPFKPENPDDITRLKSILDELHEQFIALVKDRRGDKVNAHDDVFTGAFWTAEEARKRGLVDGIAQFGDFIRARFGDDVKIKKIETGRGSLLKRLMGGESRAPQSPQLTPEAIVDALEAKALWSRFGL